MQNEKMDMKKYILSIVFIFLLLAGCTTPNEPEAKTLRLAVFGAFEFSNSELTKWVNKYNQDTVGVTIEMVNYSENVSDPFEALNQIKIEIAAGKGPDLINFNNLSYSPLDASCGILADLYPLMQNDNFFNRQDFYGNIIDSFSIGDSLYVLVPNYRIASFVTANKELSGLERMDISDLIIAYDLKDEHTILFPGETKNTVLGMICYRSLENFIDWDKGICHFNSDSFKNILHFANRFPLVLNFADDHSVKDFFTEGRTILYPVSISNVYETAGIRMLYGKTPTYIGYPFDSGNGHMAMFNNIAIGISATSKYKDEAWSFLKSFLESEYQNDTKGLPLKISSLELKLAAAMNVEYDLNEEKIIKEQVRFEGEEPINIYAITNEDAEILKKIISKIEFNGQIDGDLYAIILEEAEYVFNDNRSVDVIADIIQNRVSIYMKEKK